MSSAAFQRLAEFLQNEMRMSHIYQPLMLKLLLEQGGRASKRDIAAAFLSHDESQLDYYETVTNRMPGGGSVGVFTAHRSTPQTGFDGLGGVEAAASEAGEHRGNVMSIQSRPRRCPRSRNPAHVNTPHRPSVSPAPQTHEKPFTAQSIAHELGVENGRAIR